MPFGMGYPPVVPPEGVGATSSTPEQTTPMPGNAVMNPPPQEWAAMLKDSGQKGGDWKKVLAAAAAGLGIGLLGSKMSGGDISFGEAVGMLGKGYADDRYGVMTQNRKAAHEQHSQQLKMIHDFFSSEDMQGIDTEKYPKIKELQQKYSEKLMNTEKGPGGEPLSAKETTELLGLITTAQGEIGRAKVERMNEAQVESAKAKQKGEIAARGTLYEGQNISRGGTPLTLTPEGGRMAASQDMLSQLRMNNPVPVPPRYQPYLGNEAPRADVGRMRGNELDLDAAMARIKTQIGMQDKSLAAMFDRETARMQNQGTQAIFVKAFDEALHPNPMTGKPPMNAQDALAFAMRTVDQYQGIPGSSFLPPGVGNIKITKRPGSK